MIEKVVHGWKPTSGDADLVQIHRRRTPRLASAIHWCLDAIMREGHANSTTTAKRSPPQAVAFGDPW